MKYCQLAASKVRVAPLLRNSLEIRKCMSEAYGAIAVPQVPSIIEGQNTS